MFKAFLFSLFLFLVLQLQAQHLVQGRVYNAKTREAVAGATVYINNSSIGTSTDKTGAFKLSITQSSVYELVVSAMGYHGSSTQVKIQIQNQLKFHFRKDRQK
ncbi:carboxypeptidase-like regulatory domain-containing protein [Sphingobacterium kyonggiense]